MNTVAINISGISKKYEIHHEKPTLVEKFVKGKNETFWALKNINLTIQKGERVGLMGPNGSGKTTLLKIIAGITTPTHGTIEIQGKIVSLIDLEAGFHEDLTGEQNIYLNGMLLGMTKDEVGKKLKPIINFADIHQFIDAPLFTYSQGMRLRLGFSIAIHSNPDIMILDEGFLAGDEDFRKKAMNRILSYKKSNMTMIIVTHWREFLEMYCKRIITMSEGKIVHEQDRLL